MLHFSNSLGLCIIHGIQDLSDIFGYDQMLLSSGMLDNKGLFAGNNAFRCFSFSPMLDDSGNQPYATYAKRTYQGGYSDHLPLLLKAKVMK